MWPRRKIELSKETIEHFVKTNPRTGCWEWQRSVKNDGYGQWWYREKNWVAHRLVYTLFIGKIPEGLCICHSCSNKRCVNPKHLYVATHKENTRHYIELRDYVGQVLDA